MLARLPMLVLFVACLTSAAAADVLDTPIPAPAWTKTVGIMRVQKYGHGTPALVLVPGLACGAWTWRDTIAREMGMHTIYAVTLAGFDGLPLVPNTGIDAADASLQQLITSEKLDRPVIVGHSLGGFLVVRFGTEHPAELRAVVSVDGLPVLPQYMQSTAAERQAAGAKFTSGVSDQPRADFQRVESAFIHDYVTDPALAEKVTALSDRSDQKAVALYGGQLYASDIRADLPKLTVPTLVIAPVPAKPLPSYLPAEMSSMSPDQIQDATVGFYKQLFAGAPQLTVVPIDNARHFVMLDEPEAFTKALDTFIGSLK